MIGKGIFSFDDQYRFGKLVDELAKYSYTIMFVPRKGFLVVCHHKDNDEKIKKIAEVVEEKGKGVLKFAKIRWQ